MSRAQDVTTRGVVLLAALAGTVLGSTTLPASPGVGAAVLATALAALLVLAMRQVHLTGSVPPVLVVARRDPGPSFSGRVTDPIHHPLRPRAPGPA